MKLNMLRGVLFHNAVHRVHLAGVETQLSAVTVSHHTTLSEVRPLRAYVCLCAHTTAAPGFPTGLQACAASVLTLGHHPCSWSDVQLLLFFGDF